MPRSCEASQEAKKEIKAGDTIGSQGRPDLEYLGKSSGEEHMEDSIPSTTTFAKDPATPTTPTLSNSSLSTTSNATPPHHNPIPASPVTVVPYDPDWPSQYEAIKLELEGLLTSVPYISIEHVGSTSVPGLAAKPIIDIDIIVKREDLEAITAALTPPNGPYMCAGEWGIPDRFAFRIYGNDPPPVARNLYICIEGCHAVINHLGLRRVLREDEKLRDEYGRVKKGLAVWVEDVNQYGDGKSEVIGRILQKAGLSQADLRAIREVNRDQARRKERYLVSRHLGEYI